MKLLNFGLFSSTKYLLTTCGSAVLLVHSIDPKNPKKALTFCRKLHLMHLL